MATTKKPAAGKNEPASPEKKQSENRVEAATDTVVEKKKAAPVVVKKNAKKEAEEQKDPEVKIATAIDDIEAYIYKNGKTMLLILVVLVIVAALFLGYKYLYQGNRTEKAGTAMFVAEQHFLVDSFAMALNGDGSNPGFLEIAENFGSTPQGNIANHYAGVCYLKLGDLDNALASLEQYNTTKGAPNEILNAQNFGLRGDIYVQKQQYDQAAGLYEKAVAAGDNSFSTPYYLKKLALVYGKLGKSAEATAALQRIADQYPASMEGRDVEKYIGAEEQK